MPEGRQNTEALFDEILSLGGVVALVPFFCDGTPEGQLRLHTDTQTVGSRKGSLRRAAGVKTVVVDAILLCPAENLYPTFQICGGIARQRVNKSVVLTPEENGLTKIVFAEPVRNPTSGQACVFYDGDIVVGGGKIL